MANETPPGHEGTEAAQAAHRVPRSRASATERAHIAEELRNVEFPVALRGYDRGAVDRYVQRVNRLIAELEVSASPESAVRHALEEVSEETRGLLERAHQTAEEIVERSRDEAGREADEMRAGAEAQVQELEASAEAIRRERQRLIEEVDAVAQQLRAIVEAEAARLAPEATDA